MQKTVSICPENWLEIGFASAERIFARNACEPIKAAIEEIKRRSRHQNMIAQVDQARLKLMKSAQTSTDFRVTMVEPRTKLAEVRKARAAIAIA